MLLALRVLLGPKVFRVSREPLGLRVLPDQLVLKVFKVFKVRLALAVPLACLDPRVIQASLGLPAPPVLKDLLACPVLPALKASPARKGFRVSRVLLVRRA